jgi:transposase
MHKRYSVFVTMDRQGKVGSYERKNNHREELKEYLASFPKKLPIAVESTGNWYWFIDLIEEAGLQPMLAHPRKSKMMMGHVNKTDKLDAKGLATLLRNGTLPSVWIPPAKVRDQRELLRWRMTVTQIGVKLKNRIQATFANHGIKLEGPSDLFGIKGKEILSDKISCLPTETQKCIRQELNLLEQIQIQVKELEHRIKILIKENPPIQLIQSAPGIGMIHSMVICAELGDISRFSRSEKVASYCGLVPRVHSSGGKTYYGKTRNDVNRYLKWAFVEAANGISRHRKKWQDIHAVRLYERIRYKKGHSKAIVAVGRHLSEAVFWMLTKNEPYKEPKNKNVSSTPGQARSNYAM